jgi:hypothetical protein
MPIQQAKMQGISIVLIGSFNPQIFQPAWFGSQKLLKEKEAEESRIAIIHPEIVEFSSDWFKLQVTQERFSASTLQEPYYEILRDLVLSTFRILKHTPIKMMGLNTESHYQMVDEEKWHTYGNTLAPKESWKNILENPGMRSLTMEESNRKDGLKGYIRVKIEPSVLPNIHPGIFFQVNDHYEASNLDVSLGATEIIGYLEKHWKESRNRASKIIKNLLEIL